MICSERRALQLEILEDRILLDANPLAVAALHTDGMDANAEPALVDGHFERSLENYQALGVSAPINLESSEESTETPLGSADNGPEQFHDPTESGALTTAAVESLGDEERLPAQGGNDADPAAEPAPATLDNPGESVLPTDYDGGQGSGDWPAVSGNSGQQQETSPEQQNLPIDLPQLADDSGFAAEAAGSVTHGTTTSDGLLAAEVDSFASDGFSEYADLKPMSPNNDAETQDAPVDGFDLADLIDPMIGEDFQFVTNFDNTGAQTGYGPYIDLYFPTTGKDGLWQSGGYTQDPDGISFVDATYLGLPLTPVEQTFGDSGIIDHPLAVDASGAPVQISGMPGDTYVTLQMPFGSFTPDQPAAEVSVTAHLSQWADVGDPATTHLDVEVSSGFQFGNDPVYNPATDPSITGLNPDSLSFLPEVVSFEKTYLGPESETATGPNFPHTYQITVNVADSQAANVSNLLIIENLPDNIYYLGDGTVTGGTVISSPGEGVHGNAQLVIAPGPISSGSATVSFRFYVPEQNAAGLPVIDPATGNDVDVENDAAASGRWVPTDPRDVPTDFVIDAEDPTQPGLPDDVFSAKSVAIQKAVAISENTGHPDYSPGDVLVYTLDFQISDYFAYGNLAVQDLLPDGLAFLTDPAHAARFEISDQFGSYPVGSDPGLFVDGVDMTHVPVADDDTQITFFVSRALVTAGDSDGILEGGRTNGTSGGGATGTITYYAEIRDNYLSVTPPADTSVDQGDVLANQVSLNGDIYGYDASGQPTVPLGSESDDSQASVQIALGEVKKDIYAINDAVGVTGTPHLKPGDTITYRLGYDLPTSDYENLELNDFLPLPILKATDPDADGSLGPAFVFDAGAADRTDPPAAGFAQFGPGDTFYDFTVLANNPVIPNIQTEAADNRLSFIFASFDSSVHPSTTVEILFTVTVSSDPFADGLYLTNQVQGRENGTSQVASNSDAVTQIILDQPSLEITKGVVTTDNPDGAFSAAVGPVAFTDPGSLGYRAVNGDPITSNGLDNTPVDANLENIDAADLATFAIVVQNVGHANAFDVRIDDELPAGFEIPAGGLNLSVTDGTGAALVYFTLGDGPDGVAGNEDDFFSGIELVDDADGLLDSHDPTSGTNIVLVTYDLAAVDTVEPLQQITNTARLTQYAGDEGAANHAQQPFTDQAVVAIAQPRVDKSLDTGAGPIAGSYTNRTHTLDPDVAIGEMVYYTAVITLPEGTSSSVILTDQLDRGLAIVSLDHLSASTGDLSAANGPIDDSFLTGAHTAIASGGRSFSLDFGDVINGNRENQIDETISIQYTAVVLNSTRNDRGDRLNNDARWSWTENGNAHDVNDGAAEVVIVEPDLRTVKTVDDPAPDSGDVITFSITVDHGGASDADAFEVVLSDVIPGGLSYVANSLQHTAGLAPDAGSLTISGDTFAASWTSFNRTASSTLAFQATVDVPAVTGDDLSNTAAVSWTGLPGDVTVAQSIYNALSTERTGDTSDPGGNANDYRGSGTAAVSVRSPAVDKQDPSPVQYTIGDEVTYAVLVSLPEADTRSLEVTDALPEGMRYENYSLITTAAGSNGLLSQDFSDPLELSGLNVVDGVGDGNDVAFRFGDVSVRSNNNPDDNSFVIRLTATVLNDQANQQGDVLINETSISYLNPSGSTVSIDDPDPPAIFIIEPQITTAKEVSPNSGVTPGDLLTYTTRFENTGDSPAYETIAVDALASGTQFVSLTAAGYHDTTAGTDSSILAVTDAIYDDSAGTVSFGSTDDDSWDIAIGDWVQVQYTVRVMGAGFVGGPHTNTVDADWTSQNGGPPDERIYDDTPGHDVDADQDVDDAVFTVTADGSIGDVVFFDSDADGAPHEVGEPGISGVQVAITADVDGDGIFEYSTTATTGPGGTYLFGGLAAFGNYTVSVSPAPLNAAGYLQTYDLDGVGSPHSVSGVSLATGQDRSDVDFGYTGQNSVGDTIWYDVNGDGAQDGNEGGIGGLDVILSGDIDGDGIDEYTATLTTNTDGTYGFEHLPGGRYTVSVVPPDGAQPTYDQDGGLDNRTDFNLAAIESRDDIDFGYRGAGSIGDLVFFDAEDNGIWNAGDPGITGVELAVSGDIDADGIADYTAALTTDADGNYLFDHLLAGSYTVSVDSNTLPGGMLQTVDPDGTLDNATVVLLAADQQFNDADFGYTGSGQIGDFIFFDDNLNGIVDTGEVGIANVDLAISGDIDGDGIFEYTGTTTTDVDGNYAFAHLPQGRYTISVDPNSLPPGFSQTADPDGVLDNQSTLDLGAAEINSTMDFGYASVGAIGDFVFFDADADGIQDPGEVGIGRVTVTLVGDIDNDGLDETLTKKTNANGKYLFDNLPAGNFTITVSQSTLPGGMRQTVDPDIGLDGSATVVLTASEQRLDVDFGYTGLGSIGDTVWIDQNSNGVQDPAELGIGGVGVALAGDFDGDGRFDYTTVVETDNGGHYLFAHLPAGRYTIRVDAADLPPGLVQNFDPDGILDDMTAITLAARQQNLGIDFGYYFPPEPPVPPQGPGGVVPGPPEVTPPEAIVPPPVRPQTFAFDALFMPEEPAAINTPADLFFEEMAWHPWNLATREQVFQKPLIPVSPIYSGSAQPGTTLRLDLYDALGDRIGSQTIMADTAGNWLAGFSGTLMYDEPHQVSVQQTFSSYIANAGAGYNLRPYFSPALESKPLFFSNPSADAIFAAAPSTVLDTIYGFNRNPLKPDWDEFYGYEFLVPSANPSQISQ